MKIASIALVLLLGILLVSGLACSYFMRTEVQIGGINMEPTIMDGQVCTVDKSAYIFGAPERGDVVAFGGNDNSFISRVIGLPGETISIEDGAVYVEGTILDEPYLPEGTLTESATKEFNVLENSYFLMGDNRANSSDSRIQGFVPLDMITGKVLHCEFE